MKLVQTSFPVILSRSPSERTRETLVDEPGSRKNAQERQYRLLEELGRGAMGVVWKGQHIPTSKICAIKLLLDDSDLERKYGRERAASFFERDFNFASRIGHPNVIRVDEAGITFEGTPFFTME